MEEPTARYPDTLTPLPADQCPTPPLKLFMIPGEIRLAVNSHTSGHDQSTGFIVWRVDYRPEDGTPYVRPRAYRVNLAQFIGACGASVVTPHDPYTAWRIRDLRQGTTVPAHDLVEGTAVARYHGDIRSFEPIIEAPRIERGDLGAAVVVARFGLAFAVHYRPTDLVEIAP